MLGVWRQLRGFAGEFLRANSLGVSAAGRIYLDWLLLRGAAVIAQERLADDPNAIDQARGNIELLLASAAGMAVAADQPEELLAGVPRPGFRRRISALDLRRALRHLPPLWPLNTRRRDARPA